jgi:hypothetical protein
MEVTITAKGTGKDRRRLNISILIAFYPSQALESVSLLHTTNQLLTAQMSERPPREVYMYKARPTRTQRAYINAQSLRRRLFHAAPFAKCIRVKLREKRKEKRVLLRRRFLLRLDLQL